MSGSKHISAAEQAREAYRQKRLERSRSKQTALYPAPELAGVLDPITGDDRTLWPKANWGTDIGVVIPPISPKPEVGDVITLVVAGAEVDSRVIDNPDDPVQFMFSVSAAAIGDEGRYEFSYIFQNADFNLFPSDSVVLTVDRTPPNNNVPGTEPLLPVDLIDNELRLDYLDDRGKLEITVPRSSDITAGDIIEVFWGKVEAGVPVSPAATRTVSETDTAGTDPLVLDISAAVIKTLPDGHIGIAYRYVDRAGNLGYPSAWARLYVDLDPLPESLATPEVPLALDDGLIDRTDAQMGVTVEIPSPGYTHQKPGDKIQVSWEGELIEPVPLAEFPMEISVPWEALAKKGHNTERAVKVKYSVVREKFRADSAEIDVNVDFTVAGTDPGPDNPGPINPALPLVVIKSRDPSGSDNVLGEADKGETANAVIPSNPAAAGDKLRLYWGTLESFVDEVDITGEGPTDPITFNVAWDDIIKGGYNEKLPVYYSTWNGVNEQASNITNVDVRIIDVIGLREVEFPDRWPGGLPGTVPMINCCSKPWNGVRFQVLPDPDNFSVDDTLDISWQAYSDRNSSSPIVDTDFSFPTVTLNQEMIEKGFEMTVPYEDHVEPIVTSGSGTVTCVLTRANGQSGSSVTRVRVSRVGTGDQLCTPANPGICS